MIRPRFTHRTLFCLIAAPALLASTAMARDTVAERDRPFAWRDAVMPRDRTRLRNWRQAWLDGLAQARAKAAAQVDAEGALLNPDAAQNDPAAPDGAYRCRTIKLGGGKGMAQMPPAACTITRGHFDQTEGQQRVAGNLWRYDGVRMLLLGAMSLGDEKGSLPYGRDQERDAIGFFERIGPHRWRIVLPRPAWEAALVVIEIVPAGS